MTALVDSVGGFIDAFGGLEKISTVLGTVAAIFFHENSSWNWLGCPGYLECRRGIHGNGSCPTLAIPIAIGAIVVAVGLMVDDIITFFQGGESYFRGDLFPGSMKLRRGLAAGEQQSRLS